ncbi:MAG: MaoC family dehydratase [Desulfotignum sp.]|nr:MaoC family dehydratase [Desulfotignum sp.]
MRNNEPYAMYLENFKVGDIFKHFPAKTVTESDNNLFCLLTCNHHPIHSDIEFAKKSQHGKILVVGTYVLSLVVGMSVPHISGMAIANLEYENVVHNGPVHIGDTIYAQSEILDVRESKSKNDRGIIYVETMAFNQKKEKILTFRRRVLLPKQKI